MSERSVIELVCSRCADVLLVVITSNEAEAWALSVSLGWVVHYGVVYCPGCWRSVKSEVIYGVN